MTVRDEKSLACSGACVASFGGWLTRLDTLYEHAGGTNLGCSIGF